MARRGHLFDLRVLLPDLVQQPARAHRWLIEPGLVQTVPVPQRFLGRLLGEPLLTIILVPLECLALSEHPSIQLGPFKRDSLCLLRTTGLAQATPFGHVCTSASNGGLSHTARHGVGFVAQAADVGHNEARNESLRGGIVVRLQVDVQRVCQAMFALLCSHAELTAELVDVS
eukprot:scaffold3942_cov123-Isochrysis_galbana.AAC.11